MVYKYTEINFKGWDFMSQKEISWVKDRIMYLMYRGYSLVDIAKGARISKDTIYKFMHDEQISVGSFYKLRTYVAHKSRSIFMSKEDRKNTGTMTLSEFLKTR
jgi:hypothetical protein